MGTPGANGSSSPNNPSNNSKAASNSKPSANKKLVRLRGTRNQSGDSRGRSRTTRTFTRIREYASAGASTPYRTTERWYYPRDDANGYVVNRVAQEKLWEGDVQAACRGQTRWIYDNASGQGQFTRRRRKGY